MHPTGPSVSSEQEFPYGWRFVKRALPDGTETLEQIPLTLEDALHPQEDDVIPESKPHEADRRYLTSVFESRPLSPPIALVTSDLLIHWGVEGVRDHSPDVAVFVGLTRGPDSVAGTLDLTSFGGRCELVVELVSPRTRDNDVVKKMEHYHRLGIPMYVLIDQHAEDGPRFLRAYRRKPDRYVEIESDDKGRIDVPLLGLLIGLRDDRAVCYDLRTQRELGDYVRIARALEESERQREQAQQAREQLEQAMDEQVEARRQAQRQADDARREADRQREEAERAQKEADRQRDEADRQRLAREAAENDKKRAEELAAQRIRDLEEMVKRLQAGAPAPTPPAAHGEQGP